MALWPFRLKLTSLTEKSFTTHIQQSTWEVCLALLLQLCFHFLRVPHPAVLLHLPRSFRKAHLVPTMPLADSTIEIYNQPGFVPDSLMQQWAESEYTIGPIVEWLGIDEPAASAVSNFVGYTSTTHVSGISGIPIDEWEDMLRDPGLGIRLTMGV